jgi:hypothetical protein
MSKLIACLFILAFTVSHVHGQSQTKTAGSAPVKQQASPTFTERLLKFLGISDSPSTLKGPGDEVTSGELWLCDLDSKSTRALTSNGAYRSPIFLEGTKNVLALRGSDVMQVSSGGGEGKKLYSVDGITKLVGSGPDEPGNVLILLRGESGGHPRVALLTVSTGAVTVIPYDPSSSEDLQMVENLQGWSRTYGDKYIYVKRQSKQALSGTVEWSDVFLKVGNQEALDVSQCDGAQCGQPSLSENGRLLVFVKAKTE